MAVWLYRFNNQTEIFRVKNIYILDSVKKTELLDSVHRLKDLKTIDPEREFPLPNNRPGHW